VAACEEARGWKAALGGAAPAVSVNVAPRQLLDPRLPDRVEALLDRCGLDADRLILEITEGALMKDPAAATVGLERLSRLGVRLAVDDFGTGYSSLAVLRELPVREIKIDRSFVAGLTQDAADETIVRSTIGLAHDLELEVVAEGVEDEQTLRRLAELGCDQAQGWYFSRPLRLDALMAWFERPAIGAETGEPASPIGA